jgi:hypothetical protein
MIAGPRSPSPLATFWFASLHDRHHSVRYVLEVSAVAKLWQVLSAVVLWQGCIAELLAFCLS